MPKGETTVEKEKAKPNALTPEQLKIENDNPYIQMKCENLKNNIMTSVKNKLGVHRYILSWVVVLGFYILTYILMIKPIPKDSNQVVFMLFGTISTGFGTVLGYFFGSSQSSVEKDHLLNNQNDQQNNQTRNQ